MISDTLRDALERVRSKPQPAADKPQVFRFEVLRPLHFRGEPHMVGDVLHATLAEARMMDLGDTSAAVLSAPRTRVLAADRDALQAAILAEQTREGAEARLQQATGWVKRW